MRVQKANPEFYAIIYGAFERTRTLDVFLVLCVFCFVLFSFAEYAQLSCSLLSSAS